MEERGHLPEHAPGIACLRPCSTRLGRTKQGTVSIGTSHLYDGWIDPTQKLRPILHPLLVALDGCREVAHVRWAFRAPESHNALNAACRQHWQMRMTL